MQLDLANYFNLEYVIIALTIVILYLLYYVYTKDNDYNKNLRSVASVVEDLNREIYYLKKNMDETKKSVQSNTRGMSDEEIYAEIERSVYDMIQPLSSGFIQLQENMAAIDAKVDSRVSALESGVKQFSIPSSINGNDDEKVISLYKQGVTLETISKELNISQAEVDFVLKINKLK